MATIKEKYKTCMKNRAFLMSCGMAFLLLIISFIANFYVGIYAVERASNPVTDIILSNIRVYDVDGIFIYGPIVLWTFVMILLVLNPKKIPFTIKSVALFTLIRSLFVSLTHIGPFPGHLVFPANSFITYFTSGSDLFFSGHTGLPFLLALIFWENENLRWIFIGASILFGIVSLLGHLHYSIDVLSAFFITYTIYHLSERFFRKDRRLFFS